MGILGLITAQVLAGVLMHAYIEDPPLRDQWVELSYETESPPVPEDRLVGYGVVAADTQEVAEEAALLRPTVLPTIESWCAGTAEPPESKVLVSL